MRVLIVTPSFPPFQGSHTQRMVALANALVEDNIETAVLTTEILEGHPSYDPDMMGQVDNRVVIYRCPFGKLHRKAYTSFQNYTDNKYGINGASSGFKSKIVKVVEKIKNGVLLPDSLIDWYFPTIRYIHETDLINKYKPDFLLSCSMPNTVHVICEKIHREYHVPVLMDYADPWVYIAYYEHGKVRFNIEKKMEERCIQAGSLYSFSTPGAEKLYIDKFGLSPKKTFTALTGYDDKLKTGKQASAKKDDEQIVLTYGGALQIGIRNPEPFLKVIQKFVEENVTLKIRTDDVMGIQALVDKHCPKGKKTNITVEKYIPFDAYYEEMLSSDVLVFWGNTTSDQLPGKIFNYLPTRKLIFYIANNSDREKDQAMSVIEDYGNYIYVNNDEISLESGLREMIAKLRNGEIKEIDEDKILKYSTQNQFAVFAEKIRNYLANN